MTPAPFVTFHRNVAALSPAEELEFDDVLGVGDQADLKIVETRICASSRGS